MQQEDLDILLWLLVCVSATLTLLWIILPFYIVSMNRKLREQLDIQRELLDIQREAHSILDHSLRATLFLVERLEVPRSELPTEGTQQAATEPREQRSLTTDGRKPIFKKLRG